MDREQVEMLIIVFLGLLSAAYGNKLNYQFVGEYYDPTPLPRSVWRKFGQDESTLFPPRPPRVIDGGSLPRPRLVLPNPSTTYAAFYARNYRGYHDSGYPSTVYFDGRRRNFGYGTGYEYGPVYVDNGYKYDSSSGYGPVYINRGRGYNSGSSGYGLVFENSGYGSGSSSGYGPVFASSGYGSRSSSRYGPVFVGSGYGSVSSSGYGPVFTSQGYESGSSSGYGAVYVGSGYGSSGFSGYGTVHAGSGYGSRGSSGYGGHAYGGSGY